MKHAQDLDRFAPSRGSLESEYLVSFSRSCCDAEAIESSVLQLDWQSAAEVKVGSLSGERALSSSCIGQLETLVVGQTSRSNVGGYRYLTFPGRTAETPVYLKTYRTVTNKLRPGLGLSK